MALYAFCRLADDIVDDATIRGTSGDEVRQRLNAHTRGLDAVFSGRPDTPLFREIAWTVQRFGVPREPLDELLDGVALTYLLVAVAQPLLESRYGIFLEIGGLNRYDFTLLGAIIGAALLMGALPAWRAYRNTLSDGLTLRV